MFYNVIVPVPSYEDKITFRKHKGIVYVRYEYARVYYYGDQYPHAKRTTIGRLVKPNNRSKMYPTKKYYQYFSDQKPDNRDD